MRRACDIGLREMRDLRALHFNRMEHANSANLFHPADKHGRLRTMLEQKVRQRIHVRRATEKHSRECARDARILVGEQAEKLSVVQNPHKITRSPSIHGIVPTIDRTDFAFENVVEPLGFYGNVTCDKRDS